MVDLDMVVSLAVGALASAGASAVAKACASTGLVGLSGGLCKGAFAAALPAWGIGHGAAAVAKASASTGLVGLSGGLCKGAFAAALPAWGIGHGAAAAAYASVGHGAFAAAYASVPITTAWKGAWLYGHGAISCIPGTWPWTPVLF
jgi:hypothetical protein